MRSITCIKVINCNTWSMVKQGNLLMVGGHVKVGDFGCLKIYARLNMFEW